jgi:large subunit ribosomal protein L9
MSTQVILTTAVEKLGAEGDTVTVADGYARNYLIPKGLAVPATRANLRRIEALRKKREAAARAELEQARSIAERLLKQSYTVAAAAGPDGKLYGSVTTADISEALAREGIEVDRRKILLQHPIRELGVYDIEVKLHPEVTTKVKIWVVASEQSPATPPPPAEPKQPKKTPKPASDNKP